MIATIVLAVAPSLVSAQTTAYVPPKLESPGTNSTALAGRGDVTVQVFVKKDGTFTVNKVLKSTNAADNAAALEIAKTSKYKPAIRDGKPIDAYYDYVLSFAGDGAAAANAGPLAGATASIRAAKYDDAKTQLNAYLQAHPGDTQAYTLLGVANAFGGDPAAASLAFEKAGTVPDQYKTLAIQSYAKYASALLDAKKFGDAVTYAGHAIDADPNNLQAYYVRGIANSNLQNDAGSIADLQKARTIAQSAKSDDKTVAMIDFNLAVSQLAAGQFGEAATTTKEAVKLDPSRQAALDKFAVTAVNNAAVALANQGKIADAVSRLESGATAFPAGAAQLYVQAAYIYATDKKPDWRKVQSEADRALAIDASNGRGNYIRGVAAAQQDDPKTAIPYLNKAKSSTAYTSDAALAKQIDDALKALNAPGKSL
jgi:tetratricopeptide (TPR) repeat protein